jgi:integrase
MAEADVRLTVKRVERLKGSPGRYSDGQGLYLQVVNANNRSWVFRYERAGRERFMGLGPVHTLNLAEAREKARKARQLLLEGIDPLDARTDELRARAEAVKTRLTFQAAAQAYNDAHERKWGNPKHRAQFLSSLRTYAFPILGDMPVAAIDTPAVLRAIEPHWHSKTETMARVRGRIESVLDWATVRGYRSGDNPARWRGHLSEVLPARNEIAKVEHHPALDYRELPGFMSELRKREGMAARALELTILCAARTGEVIGALRSEIDLVEKVWTIPAGRMKGGREHRVPLSKAAFELLWALPTEDGNPFVFIGSQPRSGLSSQGMTQVLRRMGRTDVSVHGFRSSFRVWCAEQTNFPRELAELALAHNVGDKTERAYQRGDLLKKRFALAEAWGKYCTSSPVAQPGSKVVPLHGAAR